MSRSRMKNEESVDLLAGDDELPAVDLFDDRPQAMPRLNVAQRILGGVNEYLFTVAPIAAGTAIVMQAGMAESNYAFTAVAVIGTKEALNALRALGSREHPLAHLREQGHGSFALGLAREGRKKLVAAIPPVMVATITSMVRDHIFDAAMKDPENNQFLVTTLLYLTSEPMRALMIATPTLGLYMLDQLILDRVKPSDEWYQGLLRGGMRIVDAVALAEMTLLIMNTMIGDETRHSPYTLLLAVAFDQFLLQALRRLAEVPHPMRDVTIPCTPRVVEVDDNGDEIVSEPSRLRDAFNIGTRFAIASALFTGAAAVSRYASAAVSSLYQNGGEVLNDPTLWLTSERIGYQVLMLVGVMAAEQVVDAVPAVVRAIHSSCCRPSAGGMFARRAEDPASKNDDDLEKGLARADSDEDVTAPVSPPRSPKQ